MNKYDVPRALLETAKKSYKEHVYEEVMPVQRQMKGKGNGTK